jgi:hypothetical protein
VVALAAIAALVISPCLECPAGAPAEAVAATPGHGHGHGHESAAPGDACATITAPSSTAFAPVSNPPADVSPAAGARLLPAAPPLEVAAGSPAAPPCDGVPRVLQHRPLRI